MPIQNKSIIVDVGANIGGFSLEIAMRNPKLRVYAIEPEPELIAQLNQSSQSLGTNNHIVCNFAVSDKNGAANFYVSHEGDWGTSSLLPFDNSHIKQDPYWSTRSDLVHSSVIRVDTKRLDTFLDGLEYDEIKFIKIDAQGFDLIALHSLGAHIERVHAGMIEVVGVKSSTLYVGEQNDLRSAQNYLADKGFIVYAIKPNDPAANEYNLFFHRLGVDIGSLEIELSLKKLTYYDGKNYWHHPSNKLEDVDAQLYRLYEVEAERDRLRLANDNLRAAYDRLSKQLEQSHQIAKELQGKRQSEDG